MNSLELYSWEQKLRERWFLNYTEMEIIRLNQALPLEWIPKNIMYSNTTKDGKYETLRIFPRKRS